MRITAGTYRGRVLAAVKDKSVRPAMDRVRASIFNILQNRLRVEGARVLDLFAGTGSLGFEALSRGAGECLFVENGRDMVEMIRKNAALLGCEEQCEVIAGDAVQMLGRLSGPYDLVFADPPYAYVGVGGLPAAIFDAGLVAADGLLVIEHARKVAFMGHPSFSVVDARVYGNTAISIFGHPTTGKDEA